MQGYTKREWNLWTVISQDDMRHNPITDSTQTDTPCRPGDLWPHEPISGMSPKDRLAKAISIPDSFLTVSQAGLALGKTLINCFFLSRR